MELNPNCSEATVRINISNLNEDEIEELRQAIECLCMSHNYEPAECDTYTDSVFGIKTIVVSGDFPYNYGDDIDILIEKARQKFKKVIDYEYAEP